MSVARPAAWRRLTGLLLLAALTIACSAAPAPEPARVPAADAPRAGGVLTMAFPNAEAGDASSLDPEMVGGTYVHSILSTIYDLLVYQDPTDGSIQPGLAASWEVSPDGLVYTFKLQPNARFHDGNPVTAEAVRFTLERAVDPAYRPNNVASARLMIAYDHTEVVDDLTARVYLKEPQANFLPSVVGRTQLAIVSPRAVERLGVEAFGENPVGSGPYRFVEWVRGERIVVERNPDYAWGSPIFKHSGPPLVDRIVFRYIPEPSTRLAALESGEVNAIDGVPEADQDRLARDSRFEIVEVRKNGTTGRLTLNNRAFPTSERAVRVALNQAIDKDAVNRNVYYGVHRPTRYLLEDRMFAFNPDAVLPAYDPAVAKRTLDDAGWLPGPDGVRQRDGTRLELVGIGWDDRRVLEVVQAQLREVGIALRVEMLSRAAAADRATRDDWHVYHELPQGWTNEDPHILYTNFHSSNIPPQGTSNPSKVAIGEVDDLLARGLTELDPDRRRDLYVRAQAILAREAVGVPLVSMYRNLAVRKGVHGITPDVRGTYRYYHDVWIEP